MFGKVVWEDINRKSYTMDQITDEHLLNIMSFLEGGGGYREYRDKQTFKLMRDEIRRRGLERTYDRHQLRIESRNLRRSLADLWDVICDEIRRLHSKIVK